MTRQSRARLGLPARRTAVGVLALGGVALLGAGRGTWVTAQSWTALADVEVSVSGSRAAPVVAAAGLLVVAAALVLAIARRVAAVLAAVVAAGGGALAVVGAIGAVRDVDAVASSGALRAVGVGALTTDVALTPLVWLAVALGVAVVAAGAVTVPATRRWSVGTRHDAPAVVAASASDDWTALTRGEDPSAEDVVPLVGEDGSAEDPRP